MSKILIVENEKSMRDLLTIVLEKDGHEVETARNGEVAVDMIQDHQYDVVLTDINMPRANGIDVLDAVNHVLPGTPVIMMTAYASAETAVETMKKGAYDYLSKPFKIEELQLIIKNAAEKKRLADENTYLKSALKDKYQFANIIGKSEGMRQVFDYINKVANSNATVLIGGESGTGKELVAKALHFNSNRKNYPFISINCGAMPENLLESELFGHEKGAFTSADSTKIGLMEAANKGTFFLDEISEAPLSIQVKLLRVLQEKEFTRVGGTKPIKVDLRIIAASNRDLAQAVKDKEFREDLYYRLKVIHIQIPPLRQRKEDISLLVHHFITKYCEEYQGEKKLKSISPEAIKVLENYDWPGNVRELENVLERAVVLESQDTIQVDSLPEELMGAKTSVADNMVPSLTDEPIDLESTLDRIEKKMLLGALDKSDGMINKAAQLLNLSFRSMRYRVKKHNLKGKMDKDDG
ncbi:Transcriptional regulatory protein pilR [Nitrospina gracilis 3/211]|uniref:Transcriptional regulatory protein pilR n=1 Tax=Nitrospina gracilis (strain 3/211) TaxID=1266370 RepID=M1Z1E7_NITG3|nr:MULTISPECIES: sigma-54 dependent transcriptional regulator [Nitrospina]MCF8724626.1 two-component system response regulator PilR (NtrC family) [Nitrospina sp. Nb-3]CCQ91807.1 Transcriptional regulatory protein pilR [Nitrospina gracilis 3/211]